MSETSGDQFLQRPRNAWLINALIFQVGWLVCVLGGSGWALAFTIPALIFHLMVFPQGNKDGVGIALAVVLGLLHDNLLATAGVFVFPEGSGFSPLWLSCLWVLMGTSFNHSLRWVYHRPLLAALVGAISGPLAYLGGISLSDVDWGMPVLQSLAILATLWLFVLPLHRFLEHRINSLCRSSLNHP